LKALRSHDDGLGEELDSFRTALGRSRGGAGGGFSKIVVDLPRTVGDKFVTALNARIVEMTTASWHFWYGLLLDYVEEFGHARVPIGFKYDHFKLGSWVRTQRDNKARLDSFKIQLLKSLPQWSWSPFDDKWNIGFEYLKKWLILRFEGIFSVVIKVKAKVLTKPAHVF
jgi:hypothetical protein